VVIVVKTRSKMEVVENLVSREDKFQHSKRVTR
jgi:hypothetical protein